MRAPGRSQWIVVSPIGVAIALGACGGKARTEPDGGESGSHSGIGGRSGASSGDAGSGASSAGGGDGPAHAGESQGGSSGAPSTLGGAPSSGVAGVSVGGEGGENGGQGGETSGAGGESGIGSCLDVCSLYGAACCAPELACVAPEASCLVEVLAENVPITYDYATLEQRIAELPHGLLGSFTDADITSAGAQASPAALFEFHMTPAVASDFGADLVAAFSKPFRLSCNGEPLFVGVVYPRVGAAAIDTPVLHADFEDDGMLVLRLGAWQSAWLGLDDLGDIEAKERIDRAELRAALCARGVLHELEAARTR